MFTRSRVALAILATGLALASPAHAAYDDDDQGIEVDDTTPAPGQAILVQVCCFLPLSTVDIVLTSTPVLLAQVQAASDGAVTAEVVIPAGTEPGLHTLSVTGAGADGAPLTLQLAITVGGSADGTLAFTGAAVGSLVGAGAVLTSCGLLLSRARRRQLVRGA